MAGRTVDVVGVQQLQNVFDIVTDAKAQSDVARDLVVAAVDKARADATAQITRVDAALGQTAQATEELRSVAGIMSLGREPQEGDPAGMYRVGLEDVMWDGTQVMGRTQSLATVPGTTAHVETIAALVAYRGAANTVVVTETQRGGVFARDTTITTGDGGNTFRDPTEPYGWRRLGVTSLNVLHFGLVGDGETDNTPAYNALLEYITKNHRYYVDVYFPPSPLKYRFGTQTDPIWHHYISFRGAGTQLTRLLHDFMGPLFALGRLPGTLAADDPGIGTSGITFQDLMVDYPFMTEIRHYREPNDYVTPKRPGQKGITNNAALAEEHPDKYEFWTPSPKNMEQSVAFDLLNCSTVTLENVYINGAFQFMWLGNAHPGAYTSNVKLSNVSGWLKNRGLPAFRVIKGAGFMWTGNTSFFLNAPNPLIEPVLIDEKERLYMESMLSLPGSDLFRVEGPWDTWHIMGATFERWYTAYNFMLPYPSGPFQNAHHENVICDFIRGNCLDFTQNKGPVTSFKSVQLYMTAWEGRGLFIPSDSGYVDGIDLTNSINYLCGYENLHVNNPNAKNIHLTGGTYSAGGRLLAGEPYKNGHLVIPGAGQVPASAIYFGDNVGDFQITGANINPSMASGGLPWRPGYGVILGKDADRYLITSNRLQGALVGLALGQNSAPSHRRSIRANEISGFYAGEANIITDQCPPAQTHWFNTTPYVLSVSIGGGVVQQIQKGNRETNRTSGEFTLAPGESLFLYYSEAPRFLAYALQ